jgi:inner membrane protein
MDSVTHIFLGGAVAQGIFGKKLGRAAFWVGAIAATIPDLDVFIHTGDAVHDHLMHRHFMHSLAMVPVIAAISVLPFLIAKSRRALWKELFLAALFACTTHTLLDTLTSYGTMILWPFTERRFALDIIAIIDPLFTLPLIVGVIVALWRKTRMAANVGLAIAMLYMGVAAIQHQRALGVQRDLATLRGQKAIENPRVLPQIGAVLNYRSVYIAGNEIYADAIRAPFFGEALVKPGGKIALYGKETATQPNIARGNEKSIADFAGFADGFVALLPGSPEKIADMRYTASPEGFDAIWGIDARPTPPTWHMFGERGFAKRLWRELTAPTGYLPLGTVPPG